jgi:cytochrome c-type biogenesis protein CcmH
MKRAIAAAVLACASTVACAQAEEVAKPDAAVEKRLKELGEELRCLVCQNQTIADSNAPLALDLRNQIRTQIAQGRSDDQIRTYMVERYGDFVLYNPPFKATTFILWAGPLLLLGIGGAIFFTVVARRKPRASTPEAPPARRAEVEALLEGRAAGPQPGNPARSGDRTASPRK